MKLAILIQCHKNPEQVNLLLRTLQHEKITFFVHVDLKSRIKDQIEKRSDIVLLPDELRVDVKWSQISQVQATLNLMKYASEYEKFDFYWVCSGQDFPIKPVEEIVRWFEEHPNQDFLELFESKHYKAGQENHYDKRNAIVFPEWMLGSALWKRIAKRAWTELTGGYDRTFSVFKRKNITRMKFYFGSSWICLSGRTLEWILSYINSHKEYYAFFEKSNCPDESFFQTLVMNSPYRKNRADYLHYVKWMEGRSNPEFLNLQDLPELTKSEKLMARKFDLNKEDGLIRIIRETLL